MQLVLIEYENVQGLEDECAWMRQNSIFQICEAFIGCKIENLQGSCYNWDQPKILLSMGICKAK